jgi:hypothetical protein
MKNLLVLVLSLISFQAQAQVGLEEALTEAVLDLVQTPRRHLKWRSCGRELRGAEARAEAEAIAAAVAREAGTDLDPWMMLAQLMQESGLNACAFSSIEMRSYARTLGRRPTREDIRRLLTSQRVREQHNIRGVDAGIAQFRWPGAIARRYGVTEAASLLDHDTSIRIFAQSLRDYRSRYCTQHPEVRITHTHEVRGRIRVRVHSFRCADVFWAIHNSGSFERMRLAYITNVQRRFALIEARKQRYERSPALHN